MTTITLPPDLENQLSGEARRLGTTPELLAIEGLRKLFVPQASSLPAGVSLYDSMAELVGIVDGSSEPLSENCGSRFADGLEEKRDRGRL